jgi:HSP20 family protein
MSRCLGLIRASGDKYGSFQRAFSLPESVQQDKIAAAFAKGVLTVTLPKSADAQKAQKKIEIKAA